MRLRALTLALLAALLLGSSAWAAAPLQLSNRANAGSASSASLSALPSNVGQQYRLRCIAATLAGSSAGTDQLVVRDGASGTGAILWTVDLSIAANGYASFGPSCDMDVRASPGNAITVEFVNGVASDREAVNATVDIVSVGYPALGAAQ